MAISDIYNSLTFGGVNSLSYGIYITGPGVYNAPSRATEMISVPGRNGDISLDLGRYENITIEYTAGTFADSKEEFAGKIAAFRNVISSQIGYKRLTDTYNPGEYRLGVFVEGFDVSPVHFNEAGEFTLKFNCKPQRFLTSGEEEVTISSGVTMESETRFPASPLFMVEGYGSISIKKSGNKISEITINDQYLGRYTSAENQSFESNPSAWTEISPNFCNEGDKITVSGIKITDLTVQNSPKELYQELPTVTLSNSRMSYIWTGKPYSRETGYMEDGTPFTIVKQSSSWSMDITIPPTEFTVGQYETKSYTLNTQARAGGTTVNRNDMVDVAYTSDGIRVRSYYNYTVGDESFTMKSTISFSDSKKGEIVVDSTISTLGHPTYIDCETGAAYKYVDGEVVNLSESVILPSDLPILPGREGWATYYSITHTNNIQSLKMIPRWWRL